MAVEMENDMKYAYINGKILSGDKDMQVKQGLVIVTEGEKITDIVKEVPKSPDMKVVDLEGRYIMPGLINMHVHLAGNGKPQKKQRDNEKLVKPLWELLCQGLWHTRLYLICKDGVVKRCDHNPHGRRAWEF